jgi:muramoyltetrapeptide carboxypeptidase
LSQLREFVRPPDLQRGDIIRVIAPAGPFDRPLFFRGLGFLSETFRVRFSRSSFERQGYLAGDDARRLAELNQALRCPETRAIVCARGGFGCTRIAAQADFNAVQTAPKWLVGFSDVTALHCELQRRQMMSVHAANVTGLGMGHGPTRESWSQALMGSPKIAHTLSPLRPGRVTGPVIGGNLTLLVHSLAAGRLWVPDQALLFLEEVSEAPYKVDRLLRSLAQAGVFDRVSGLVMGQFTHCGQETGPGSVRSLIAEIAQQHRLVAACGLQAGHEPRSTPIVLGSSASLEVTATQAELRFG